MSNHSQLSQQCHRCDTPETIKKRTKTKQCTNACSTARLPTGGGVEDFRYTANADLVVSVPECGSDLLIVEATPGLEIEPGSWIVSDKETGQTTRRGVFAAGDNTSESHLAVVAILEGRKVAASIHRYLSS